MFFFNLKKYLNFYISYCILTSSCCILHFFFIDILVHNKLQFRENEIYNTDGTVWKILENLEWMNVLSASGIKHWQVKDIFRTGWAPALYLILVNYIPSKSNRWDSKVSFSPLPNDLASSLLCHFIKA